ncbi:MAG: OmpA family protein [Methylotetracoccus sp.]
MSTNILDMLAGAIGDQFAKQASTYLGESEDDTKSTLGMLIPALLGGMAAEGSTTDGAARLLSQLADRDVDSGILGDLAGLFSGSARTQSVMDLGTRLVQGLLGEKAAALISAVVGLTRMSSGSVGKLLSLGAPLLFGLVKKLVAEHDLFASDLMHLLQEQFASIKSKLDPRIIEALGLGALFENPVTPAIAAASAGPDMSLAAVPASALDDPSEDEDETDSLIGRLLPWLLLLAGLLGGLAWLRGCQPQMQFTGQSPPPAPGPATASPPAATTDSATALPAKIYFEVGTAQLGQAATQTIDGVAAAIRAQSLNVELTGFTDRTGDVAKNMELAKQRAFAVRDRLVAKGIAASRITMKPPLAVALTGSTTGSGSDAEARRVEISVTR